jgi:hypothetical protein
MKSRLTFSNPAHVDERVEEIRESNAVGEA